MDSFTDALGNTTVEGDMVVYNQSGYLATGYVSRITPKFIELTREAGGRYKSFSSYYAKVRNGHSIVKVASL